MNEHFRLRYDFRMNAEEQSADIMIYGEICSGLMKWEPEDLSASDFDKRIKDAKAMGVRNLNVRINSPGGDVFQAVAMRSMLMSSGIESVSISIEGLCASAATLIACVPGAHVTMSEGSQYMIHNPRSAIYGEARDMEKCAKRLKAIAADCAGIYAQKNGRDEAEIQQWMDDETWMSAREAFQRGFVDAVLDEAPVMACVSADDMRLMRMMYAHVPDSISKKDSLGSKEATDTISDAGAATAHAATENTTITSEEDEAMEMNIGEMTMEQLREANMELYNSIMRAGAQQERERMQEIDELTPPFEEYAQMAAQAKANGTSAMDYHKQIITAMRKKSQNFLEARREETGPADKVKGGSAEELDMTEESEMAKYAKDMGKMAVAMFDSGESSMY